MGSTLDCIALETWLCVRSINFPRLPITDQTFQFHSHRYSCFGVQRDKCYWFHLRVRLTSIILNLPQFNINIRTATEMRNKSGQTVLQEAAGP